MDQSNPYQPASPWPPEPPREPEQAQNHLPPQPHHQPEHHPHHRDQEHRPHVPAQAFQAPNTGYEQPAAFAQPAFSQPEAPVYAQPEPQPFVQPTVEPSLPPQLPQQPSYAHLKSDDEIRPVPVVRVLSPVGVEYVFLTISLITGAIGLVSALLLMFNGEFNFTALAFPTALLLVSVPLFAVIFLHLKQLELRRPELALDPSKRRSTQFTQIASFVVCLFTLVGFVTTVFASISGASQISIGKALLDSLCVLAVAGGILFYYWRDEHKG